MTDHDRVILIASDGQLFPVDRAVAEMSSVVQGILEETGENNAKLFAVDPLTLSKVLEYCNYHVSLDSKDSKVAEDAKAWDNKYFVMDDDTLAKVLLAANYMHIEPLIARACEPCAEILRKPTEEIRARFKIKNNFTPEEEAEVRKDIAWAFQ